MNPGNPNGFGRPTTPPVDSKGAAIDLLKYFWPHPFPQGKPPIEVTFNNGELVFQVPYHTFKTAILAILAQEVNKARIDENQMGLNWQLAVKNGLEQQSENAQLTSTWKANELIISQFKTRIEQLERLG